MLNFYDFYDRMEDDPELEPLTAEPSLGDTTPYEYQLANAADDFSDVQHADASSQLKTLDWDDLARASTDDVEAEMWRKKALGFNPIKLGDQMSDDELARFGGWQTDQS